MPKSSFDTLLDSIHLKFLKLFLSFWGKAWKFLKGGKELFELWKYDEVTGKFIPVNLPTFVVYMLVNWMDEVGETFMADRWSFRVVISTEI